MKKYEVAKRVVNYKMPYGHVESHEGWIIINTKTKMPFTKKIYRKKETATKTCKKLNK